MKEAIKKELSEMGSSFCVQHIGMPYALPDGYFTNFSNELSYVLSADIDSDQDMLTSRELPYKVPEGYFDGLPSAIIGKTDSDKPKGVTITFRQLRWAAAAVLLIAIGLGTFNLLPGEEGALKKESLLANVRDRDIRDYLASTYRIPVPGNADNIPLDNIDIEAKDIIAYLDETGWNVE